MQEPLLHARGPNRAAAGGVETVGDPAGRETGGVVVANRGGRQAAGGRLLEIHHRPRVRKRLSPPPSLVERAAAAALLTVETVVRQRFAPGRVPFNQPPASRAGGSAPGHPSPR